MRFRLHLSARAREIPWDDVQRPGRAYIYDLLSRSAPELGTQLHSGGVAPYGLVPFGHGVPCFQAARRRRGVYAAGGDGLWEFGSPMPALVDAFAKGLAGETSIDWGGVAMQVKRVELIEPPQFASGRAIFRTTTPVTMKGSGKDDRGNRTTRQAWLLPLDAEFSGYFAQNLRRKATTLGLGEDIQVDAITAIGPKRSFAVKSGKKVGAAVQMEVSGDPAILRAIHCWGLGQANSAGFGWIAA